MRGEAPKTVAFLRKTVVKALSANWILLPPPVPCTRHRLSGGLRLILVFNLIISHPINTAGRRINKPPHPCFFAFFRQITTAVKIDFPRGCRAKLSKASLDKSAKWITASNPFKNSAVTFLTSWFITMGKCRWPGDITIRQAPAVVTTLQEGGVIFGVFKVNKDGDKYVVTEEALPISGQAEAMVPDPSGALDDQGYPQMIISTVDANASY